MRRGIWRVLRRRQVLIQAQLPRRSAAMWSDASCDSRIRVLASVKRLLEESTPQPPCSVQAGPLETIYADALPLWSIHPDWSSVARGYNPGRRRAIRRPCITTIRWQQFSGGTKRLSRNGGIRDFDCAGKGRHPEAIGSYRSSDSHDLAKRQTMYDRSPRRCDRSRSRFAVRRQRQWHRFEVVN